MSHKTGRQFRGVLIWSAAVIAVALIYFFFDPAGAIWMPKCPVYVLTGLECPGCGTQRAIHALLHGHVAEAWGYNAGLIVALPLIGWMIWLETQRKRRPRLYAAFYSPATVYIIGAAIVGWFVVRNWVLQ